MSDELTADFCLCSLFLRELTVRVRTLFPQVISMKKQTVIVNESWSLWINIQDVVYLDFSDLSFCADADCPLREASSQRIPRLTVKVQQSTGAPQTHSSYMLHSLTRPQEFSDSCVARCEGRHYSRAIQHHHCKHTELVQHGKRHGSRGKWCTVMIFCTVEGRIFSFSIWNEDVCCWTQIHWCNYWAHLNLFYLITDISNHSF